jgi:hypothetical protein
MNLFVNKQFVPCSAPGSRINIFRYVLSTKQYGCKIRHNLPAPRQFR